METLCPGLVSTSTAESIFMIQKEVMRSLEKIESELKIIKTGTGIPEFYLEVPNDFDLDTMPKILAGYQKVQERVEVLLKQSIALSFEHHHIKIC